MRFGHPEHTEAYESPKSLPLRIHLAWLCPSPAEGPWLDPRRGTSLHSLHVFSLWVNLSAGDFLLSGTPLDRPSPSCHKPVGHTSGRWRRVTAAPRVLQALRGDGMTFNKGSGARDVAEAHRRPKPRVTLAAGPQPSSRTRRQGLSGWSSECWHEVYIYGALEIFINRS